MKKWSKQEPGQASKVILSVNLRRLMEESPHLNTQEKVAKAAHVGASSIANMIKPLQGNATLDNISKVAAVFGLEAWQILHPDLPGRVLKPSEAALYEALRDALSKLTTKQK